MYFNNWSKRQTEKADPYPNIKKLKTICSATRAKNTQTVSQAEG